MSSVHRHPQGSLGATLANSSRAQAGQHVYLLALDGADVERFVLDAHARCWLAGFGWMMVGAGGQLLERSIVDRMVAAPERLWFEGAPILVPPLEQDAEARRARVVEGEILDTLVACPPLDGDREVAPARDAGKGTRSAQWRSQSGARGIRAQAQRCGFSFAHV